MSNGLLNIIKDFVTAEHTDSTIGMELKKANWLTYFVIKNDHRLLNQVSGEDSVVFESVENIRKDVGILDTGFSEQLISLLKSLGFSLSVVSNSEEGNTLVYSNQKTAGRIRANKPLDQISRRPFNGLADFRDGGTSLTIDKLTISFSTKKLIERILDPTVGDIITAEGFRDRLAHMCDEWEYVYTEFLKLFSNETIVFKTYKTKFADKTFLVALSGERIVLFYEK